MANCRGFTAFLSAFLFSWNISCILGAAFPQDEGFSASQFADACTNEIPDEAFYIQNPGYPEPFTGAKSFSHRIIVQHGMVGVRFVYEEVILVRSKFEKSCSSNFIYYLMDGYNTEPNCGTLTKYRTSIPATPGQVITLVISTQSTFSKWKIQVTQVPEESVRFSPLRGLEDICGVQRDYDELPYPSENFERLPSHDLGFFDPLTDPMCTLVGNSLSCRLNNLLHWDSTSNRTIDDKVIGGEIARAGAYPWMAALFSRGRDFFCAGTLISPNMVLTAGHCISHGTLGNYPATAISRICDSISYHPRFREIFYDIAVCHFKEPVRLTSAITPVCLPTATTEEYAGIEGFISGWGKTSDSGGASRQLKWAPIPVSHIKDCRDAWNEIAGGDFQGLIRENMICAGGGKTATCNGDSGGPLHIRDASKNKYTQIGVTSFGPATTCMPQINKPLSVFAKISYFLPDLHLWSAEVDPPPTSEQKTFISC